MMGKPWKACMADMMFCARQHQASPRTSDDDGVKSLSGDIAIADGIVVPTLCGHLCRARERYRSVAYYAAEKRSAPVGKPVPYP